MILNLTQHPASLEQVSQGVVDLPATQRATLSALLTVDALPTRAEIVERCALIARMATEGNGVGTDDADAVFLSAMIGGAPWMMSALEGALLDAGVQPVYAFSVRESVEQVQPDGSVRKVNVFRHVGFVG